MSQSKEIVLVGTGALAQSLAYRLQEQGLAADYIYSRNPEKAVAFAQKYGIHRVLNDLKEFPVNAFVLLCIPDDALADFGKGINFKGAFVGHCSGLLTANVLTLENAHRFSFHPLQSFIAGKNAQFQDLPVAIEGEEIATDFAFLFAQKLGAKPFYLSSESKIRYHLSASIAANFLVTLQSISQSILADIGLEKDLMHVLVAETVANIQQKNPQEALTGAIVRGDVDTVKKHLAAIRQYYPQLENWFVEMAKKTVHLAVQSERLNIEKAAALNKLFKD